MPYNQHISLKDDMIPETPHQDYFNKS
jgi:hypothetical protein